MCCIPGSGDRSQHYWVYFAHLHSIIKHGVALPNPAVVTVRSDAGFERAAPMEVVKAQVCDGDGPGPVIRSSPSCTPRKEKERRERKRREGNGKGQKGSEKKRKVMEKETREVKRREEKEDKYYFIESNQFF